MMLHIIIVRRVNIKKDSFIGVFFSDLVAMSWR
jgi:hypothetical protein